MAQQFDFLAKAKPAALFKLVEKLPLEEAAVVLTGVPHMLALQTLAYFPEDKQGPFVPAMREARTRPDADRDAVAGKIKHILAAARQARETGTASPAQATPEEKPQPQPVTRRDEPDAPAPRAAMPPRPMGSNPYAPAGDKPGQPRPTRARPPERPERPERAARPDPAPRLREDDLVVQDDTRPFRDPLASVLTEDDPKKPPSPLKGLGNKLKEILKTTHEEISRGLIANSSVADKLPARPTDKRSSPRPASKRPERPANFNKPTPWVPRNATESPINGPSLPGRPDSRTGDPMSSPLAQAGLLDLIGRAQEKLLPKKQGGGTSRPGNVIHRNAPPTQAKTRTPGRPARPEPKEGVVSSGISVGNTPRVIGPRPAGGKAAAKRGDDGARNMDGKAILAAILREAGPKVRHTVQEDDPKLFRELRRRMFYFDDLNFTEDRALAEVFTAAKAEDSALALRFAAPALRERVLRSVSPGRARMLLEGGSGRAGVDDIEAAQERVLGVALKLQAAGRILIDPRDPDLAVE